MIELAVIVIWLLAGAVMWEKCGEFHYPLEEDAGTLETFLAGFLSVMVPFACIVAWPVLFMAVAIAGGTIEYDGEDGWSVYQEEDEDD